MKSVFPTHVPGMDISMSWPSAMAQQWRIHLQCRRDKRCGFSPWVWKILWRRKWQPTPIFLPGNSQGQRSLASYSPWGHKELDTTERHTHTHTHTHTQHCTFCPLTADNWLSWNAVTWEQGNVVFWIQSGDLNYRGWHPSLQKIVVLKFLRGRKNKEQKCRRN